MQLLSFSTLPSRVGVTVGHTYKLLTSPPSPLAGEPNRVSAWQQAVAGSGRARSSAITLRPQVTEATMYSGPRRWEQN